MSFAQASGYILLVLMILLAFETTKFVSAVRYNGRGIYFITINAWFRREKIYCQWLKQHRIYHWCILLIIALCPTILMLVGPFSEGNMLVRPEYSLLVNVVLWFAILYCFKWFYKNGKN